MYTNPNQIALKRALAQQMRQQVAPMQGNEHWLKALGNAIKQGVAGHQDYKADQAETQNQELANEEINRVMAAASGGAAVPLKPGVQPQVTTPQAQALQGEISIGNMRHQQNLERDSRNNAADLAQALGGGDSFHGSAIYYKTDDGYGVGYQTGNGFKESNVPGSVLPPNSNLTNDTDAIAATREAERGQDVLDFEALTGLRIEEDGAIQQQRSDIALSEDAEIRIRDLNEKRWEQVREQNAQINSFSDAVARFDGWTEDALDSTDSWAPVTGFGGQALAFFPGTAAHDLRRTLESMAAFVGFESLNNMRQQSPTGGALGQVSEMELQLLKASFGSLEQSQSKGQFVRRLTEVQTAVRQMLERRIENREQFTNPYWSDEPVVELPGPGTNELEEGSGWSIVK